MSLAAGTRFGSYEVTGPLGAGGMGEVYRATDTTLDRDVAVKVLSESLAADADRIRRFEQEAKTLASLNHANIAQIHGLERADGETAIIMELIEGPTLADRIAEGPLPVDEALHIAMQIADALEAAHERGIVHRDLKPANVKLKPDGAVKVLDFGIAKVFEPIELISGPQSPVMTTPATRAGVILGTAAYMSPEQARGKPVDQRADIWAFGCVLYEMLTGQPVFGGEDVTVTLARVLERDTDMRSLPDTIPPAVRQTIALCLKKDPRKRLHAIGDVRLALEGDFETKVSVAPDAKPIGALRFAPILATAVIAGLAGAVGVRFAMRAEPPPIVRFDLEVPQSQLFRDTGRDVLAISPDGRYLAFNTLRGIYLRAMDRTEARAIPGTEGVSSNPFFSPDGEWIAYYDGNLKKVRLDGGASVTLAETLNLQGASWSADGSILYGQPDGIMRISANGGEPELLIEAVDEALWNPQQLPDGSILFSVLDENANAIAVQTPGRDDRTDLFAGERAVYLPTGHLAFTNPFGNVGTLFVRSFDPGSREVGGPLPIEEGIWYSQGRTHFAVSASGTLAFVTGTSIDTSATVLALGDRSGIVERLDVDPNQYRGPRLSPDGTQVAVEIIGDNGRSSIWIYDLSGGRGFRQLLGAGSNSRPVWTPDGKRLVFLSDRSGDRSIFWQAADGSDTAARLTTAENNVEHWPDAWSEGETKALAFTRIGGSLQSITTQTIWSVTVDDEGRPGEPEPLVSTRAGGAAFSPSGRWLAYRSTDATVGPTQQIHVQPFPPTGEFYAISTAGGSYPAWTQDGRELIYRRPAAAGGVALTLASVEVTAGAGFAWGDETQFTIPGAVSFFGFRDYDLMPDGQRFVFLAADNASEAAEEVPRPTVQVATNWSELVKERVPAP